MTINKYWVKKRHNKTYRGSLTKRENRTYKGKPTKRRKQQKKNLIIIILIFLAFIIGYISDSKNEFIIDGGIVEEKSEAVNLVIPESVGDQVLTDSPIEKVNAVMVEPTIERVQAEIIAQSDYYGLNREMMLALADCESDFIWNAKNPTSTARGVYQYLIGTWEETQSAREGLERNNIEANIREAMLDVSNGESWRWRDCGYDLRAMGYDF